MLKGPLPDPRRWCREAPRVWRLVAVVWLVLAALAVLALLTD